MLPRTRFAQFAQKSDRDRHVEKFHAPDCDATDSNRNDRDDEHTVEPVEDATEEETLPSMVFSAVQEAVDGDATEDLVQSGEQPTDHGEANQVFDTKKKTISVRENTREDKNEISLLDKRW